MNIYFISDFYFPDIIGGAEICNNALLEKLTNYNIIKLKSSDINIDFLSKQKDDFYKIVNYFLFRIKQKNI